MSADSASYGLASETGNILIAATNGGTRTEGVVNTIVTTGCEARYILITAQVGVLDSCNVGDHGHYLGLKAGQYREVWEDNVNGDGVSYELMAKLVGRRITKIDSTSHAGGNILIEKQRVRPQFNFILSDTAYAYTHNAMELKGDNWAVRLFNFSIPTLPAYRFYDQANSSDMVSTIGNPWDLHSAGSATDDQDDNFDKMDGILKFTNWYFYVPVDRLTDYVWFYAGIEYGGTAWTPAPDVAILSMEAYPMR
jgi:hypothetical protein